MRIQRRALAGAILLAALAAGRGLRAQNADFMSPRAGQWDLDVFEMTGFIVPGGAVEVRENQVQGAVLHYSDLGLALSEAPDAKIRCWISPQNALWFEARAAFLRGSGALSAPADFNGAAMSAGQTLDASADVYTFRAAYERRFPESPAWNWSLGAGLEYDYLNFTLNGGHAATLPGKAGAGTVEDFFMQELPVPFLAVSADWKAAPDWVMEFSQQGSWINRWDSLRSEGGEVYLSQSNLETRARIFYAGDALDQIHPFAGLFLEYYYQLENSAEDGNRVAFWSWGPELGARWSF
ncbi:MAG: hypothetical protein KGI84_08020 [Elusimicrobia bacterium]|nr:hypothetical protein [Elusimicrobiota bacterium]